MILPFAHRYITVSNLSPSVAWAAPCPLPQFPCDFWSLSLLSSDQHNYYGDLRFEPPILILRDILKYEEMKSVTQDSFFLAQKNSLRMLDKRNSAFPL